MRFHKKKGFSSLFVKTHQILDSTLQSGLISDQ